MAKRDTIGRKFRFDCPFCSGVVQSATADAVKERGEIHRGEHRRHTDLLAVFGEAYGGKRCENDRGYVFPADDVVEFECPDSGHDNFGPFVRRYLYWQIKIG